MLHVHMYSPVRGFEYDFSADKLQHSVRIKAPKIGCLDDADNWAAPHIPNPLDKKRLGKSPRRFSYLCWNLTSKSLPF
jgi:hypothetical protein